MAALHVLNRGALAHAALAENSVARSFLIGAGLRHHSILFRDHGFSTPWQYST